jgi:hypothetical protein
MTSMNKLYFLLIPLVFLFSFGCKKNNEKPQTKGSIYYEGTSYSLEEARKWSHLSSAFSDNGVIKKYYAYGFNLSSKDKKVQANIQIESDDTTNITGEYFLNSFSVNAGTGYIILNLQLSSEELSPSVMIHSKFNVLFKNDRVLKINSLSNSNQLSIDWEGSF